MNDPIDEIIALLDAAGDRRRRRTVPFARSWWVIPGRFLAGYYPGHRDERVMRAQCEGLVAEGIRAVIRLTEEQEANASGEPLIDYRGALGESGQAIEVMQHPIVDFSTPTRDEMTATLDAIDAALAAGTPVYVHCWGGRGRTGTVVGCWLMRHGYASAATVLELIAAMRRELPDADNPSPENDEQRRFVREWSG